MFDSLSSISFNAKWFITVGRPTVHGLLLAFCSHVLSCVIPDSVDNRITTFGELIPLAAAERPRSRAAVVLLRRAFTDKQQIKRKAQSFDFRPSFLF